ncbi:hypothetical protein L211DRAFT_254208 [Terfezia boudieri ATCC MYA-4762]|uniref:Uncharacterized protein n=1 Tax=Terfezia boudieri ATCC MYA-4762 TaxID=1051890 RepID=A0A3N4M1K5_9PEZI|nr:hypothetical protein L211DRAFT_254208 [Terfezia boudieri ATCC MYA-4762]
MNNTCKKNLKNLEKASCLAETLHIHDITRVFKHMMGEYSVNVENNSCYRDSIVLYLEEVLFVLFLTLSLAPPPPFPPPSGQI